MKVGAVERVSSVRSSLRTLYAAIVLHILLSKICTMTASESAAAESHIDVILGVETAKTP